MAKQSFCDQCNCLISAPRLPINVTIGDALDPRAAELQFCCWDSLVERLATGIDRISRVLAKANPHQYAATRQGK
jgi:hypothetical protein